MPTRQFSLRFTAKQFGKAAKKCEMDEKKETAKCKTAIEKRNLEGARVHAERVIQLKSQALNYMRLQARMEAVSGRVDTAVKMRAVSRSMMGVVKGMDKVLECMDPVRIAKAMDQFEKQFEDLDVVSKHMETAIGTSTACSTPEDQVQALMRQIAEANDLDVAGLLGDASPAGAAPVAAPAAAAAAPVDDLAARLARLKSS